MSGPFQREKGTSDLTTAGDFVQDFSAFSTQSPAAAAADDKSAEYEGGKASRGYGNHHTPRCHLAIFKYIKQFITVNLSVSPKPNDTDDYARPYMAQGGLPTPKM